MPTIVPAEAPRHVVLDEHVVLQHGDLRTVAALADHHHAVDGLAPGQELRLGEDRGRVPGGSRPSRRRWRLASSRVEPGTPCTSSRRPAARRDRTTVCTPSSAPVSVSPLRRRLRRRRVRPVTVVVPCPRRSRLRPRRALRPLRPRRSVPCRDHGPDVRAGAGGGRPRPSRRCVFRLPRPRPPRLRRRLRPPPGVSISGVRRARRLRRPVVWGAVARSPLPWVFATRVSGPGRAQPRRPRRSARERRPWCGAGAPAAAPAPPLEP